MMSDTTSNGGVGSPSTHWKTDLEPLKGEAADYEDRLAAFIRRYRPYLNAVLFRAGATATEVEELVAVFESSEDGLRKLLRQAESGAKDGAKPRSGRFRKYLATWLRRVYSAYVRAKRAKKRGGDVEILSLYYSDSEGDEQAREVADGETANPGEESDRVLAQEFFEMVMERFQQDVEGKASPKNFKQVMGLITSTMMGKALAEETGKSEAAVRKERERLRRRLRSLIFQELMTWPGITTHEEAEAELRYLLGLIDDLPANSE